MAAPNIKSPATITTVTGKTATYSCTGTLASALSNSANSGKLLKVNVVRAANIDGTAAMELDLTLYRGSAHTYISPAISIPAKSTIVAVSREDFIYLEEGDALYAKSSTAAKIDLTISYEDIS